MKIQIIQVGKTKDRYLEDSVREFVKRLGQFCSIEISTLKSRSVEEDSMKIASILPRDALVIVLDEKGKQMNSVEFSEMIGRSKDKGETLVFVIGGAFGLSDGLKREASLLLSLSKMTFTHQMIRPFLLEQIYRGFCILNGREYHY